MGEPWNDDWSDNTQLEEYIKDVSCYFNGLNYGLVKDDKLIYEVGYHIAKQYTNKGFATEALKAFLNQIKL